jgi:hypothetical protein
MKHQTPRNDKDAHFNNKLDEVTMQEETIGKFSIFGSISHVHPIFNQMPRQENETQHLLQ